MSCSVQCVYGYRGEVDVIGEMGFWDGGGGEVDIICEMCFWDDGGGERGCWKFRFNERGGDEEGVKGSPTAHGDGPQR